MHLIAHAVIPQISTMSAISAMDASQEGVETEWTPVESIPEIVAGTRHATTLRAMLLSHYNSLFCQCKE